MIRLALPLACALLTGPQAPPREPPASTFPPVAVGIPDQPVPSVSPPPDEFKGTVPLSARVELVRLDCTTEQRRREVTLFANGTIRLREGVLGAEAGGLFDLKLEELAGYVNRLAEVDLSEVASPDRGPEGDWVSRCALSLTLADRPRRDFFFGEFDSLPLNLSRVVNVVKELGTKVPDLKAAGHLPEDFLARTGDLLQRQDGQVFRVVGYTSDGKGIELEGQDIPLALYLTPEQLRHDFVSVVRRDP